MDKREDTVMANIAVMFFCNTTNEAGELVLSCYYESFVKGLDEAGNSVLVLSHPWFGQEFGPIDGETAKLIKDFSPDICFIFNNSFYDISELVECPIVLCDSDSPIYWSNKEVLQKKPERFQYLMTQDENIAVLKKKFGVSERQIFQMQPFTEVRADKKTNADTNIVFIGTKFEAGETVLPNHFFAQKPTNQEKKIYMECVRRIRKNPFLELSELIYELSIDSAKVVRHLQIPQILMWMSTEDRIRTLSAVADMGLKIYGTENWRDDYYYDYRLNATFDDRKIYSLAQTEELYNSARIGISIAHAQALSCFPWRIADIMASNACVVTDAHQMLGEYFPGVPIPTYHSAYEARDICRELLENENRRQEIVLQCQEAIEKKYRFRHLLEKMESYFGVSMHADIGLDGRKEC